MQEKITLLKILFLATELAKDGKDLNYLIELLRQLIKKGSTK